MGQGASAGSIATAPQPALTLRTPRLGHVQWARTAQSFLRLPEVPVVSLRADATPDDAFETDDRARVVDLTLAKDYRAASDTLADGVVDDPVSFQRFLEDAGGGDAATRLRQLIATAWARAYRRPLVAEEVDRYVTLGTGAPDYAAATDDDGRLRAALRVLLRIALQSPHFVYRVEFGDAATETIVGKFRVRQLTPLEYATRLSYVLLNAPPDDALLGATTSLETPEGRAAIVGQLLADPRASETLLAFHRALYLVDASRAMRKDMATFPGTEQLGADAATEATQFLDHVAQTGGGLRELLLSRTAFVNRRLAPIYGLAADDLSDDTFASRELPAERGGILTRVSWTGDEADLFERSSILRGVYVRRKVLCQPLGNPPSGAAMNAPTPPASLVSNRDRVTYRTSGEICLGCHEKLINPLGFAFENFNAIGQFVTADKGAPVDASGVFTLGGMEIPFTGARPFLEAVAESSEAHGCYVGHLASWLYGRPLSDQDRADVAPLGSLSRTAGTSVRALLASLVTTTSFRSVVLEAP
jgi:hypothetical protein